MEHKIYKMTIEAKKENLYKIKLYNDKGYTYISYNPKEKKLHFLDDLPLSQTFRLNEYQLRKMLHNKRIDTYYVGFQLTFVFTEGKDIEAYNDRSKILVLDQRKEPYKNYVIDDSHEKVYKLYTDASFSERLGKGGIAYIIASPEGDYTLVHEEIQGDSSNLMELMAAIKGLERLKDVKKVRIITDSQYVRKGLTEWIVYWKLNDWMTVNGEKAKNIDLWKAFDALAKGKYIEFEWVKAHTNHFENTLCDLYAKEAIKG